MRFEKLLSCINSATLAQGLCLVLQLCPIHLKRSDAVSVGKQLCSENHTTPLGYAPRVGSTMGHQNKIHAVNGADLTLWQNLQQVVHIFPH